MMQAIFFAAEAELCARMGALADAHTALSAAEELIARHDLTNEPVVRADEARRALREAQGA